MRFVVICILLSFITCQSIAQVNPANFKRRIPFKILPGDSVNMSLNADYNLIEDSCAQIIRYGHFKFKERKFFGKFKDVSKADPNVIVAEGNYTDAGLKDGAFTMHYLNGDLRAKGNYKNDKFDGRWELYYDNNKPRLTFEANNNDIRIIDAWGPDGSKTVDNGNGIYKDEFDGCYWKGKLVNGKPDGTWKFINANDATTTPIVTESFKNGQFKKGSRQFGNYSDSSHIVLVNPGIVPFANVEKFRISFTACDGTGGMNNFVPVQYRNGLDAFSEEIKQVINPYFSHINIMDIHNDMVIEGEVAENGALTNLHCNDQTVQNIARGLILQLYKLPYLQPATSNNKPVRQRFTLRLTFENSFYRFTYNFSPLFKIADTYIKGSYTR